MRSRKEKPGRALRFAYPGLDRVMHERARLGILASLLAHRGGLSFGELQELCGLTDGNLSRHLQVLQSAKLVTVSRGTGSGRPQTRCRITPSGRRRFLHYLAVLEQVLLDAADAMDGTPSSDDTLTSAHG